MAFRRLFPIILLLVIYSFGFGASPAGAVTTWYVAADGSGSACTSASPCRSINAAVGKARPGDTIYVRPGIYGEQEISRSVSWDGSAASVEIRPVTPGTVTLGGINNHVPALTFRYFKVAGNLYFRPTAHGSKAINNTMRHAFVTGADNTLWRGNIIKPTEPGSDPMQVKGLDGDNPVGVTIEGNIFGPQDRLGSSHTDCLQILGGDKILVARNTFLPCANTGIIIGSGAGGTVGSVRVESNFIAECKPQRDACNGFHSAIISPAGNSVEFVHNSINGSVGVSTVGASSGGDRNFRFYGNIADSLPCTDHTDWNLVLSDPCGPNDRTGSPSWVDGSQNTQNLHLLAGSKGIAAGSPWVPSLDFDAQAGCAGGDLGADQTCGTGAPSAELAAAIRCLYDNGITTKGPSSYQFDSSAALTRAQSVTFLHRIFGEPVGTGSSFRDVSLSRYYASAVRWGTGAGVLTGYPDDTFRPDIGITRGELAVVLWRVAGSPSSAPANLPDVPADAYYAQAISWARSVGVMKGFGDGSFGPDMTIQRGHAALMITRFAAWSPEQLLDC